jgi:outer membrane protein insertion porin family
MSKRGLVLSFALLVLALALPLSAVPLDGFGGNGIFMHLLSRHVLAGRAQEAPVEDVLIRGNRRIPESTIKIWISTRQGDPYNPTQIDRDIRALYAQGHFAEVKVYAEDGPKGGKVVTFEVVEWPLILEIKYDGLKSVEVSKVLEEYRTRQIGLSKESQYDPVKAKRAAAVVKDLLADQGHPDATVTFETENISKTAVSLTFKINEGPRVRVAEIEFEGNKVFSSAYLRGQMKYVKQVGLISSIASKDIYHKEKLATDLDRLRVLVYADHGYLQAKFGEPKVVSVGEIDSHPPVPIVGPHIPFLSHKGEGIKIMIPVNEGRQYTAGDVKIEDNTEFSADEIKAVLGIKKGEIVKGTAINTGMENLKKLYGSRGYIQFNPDLGLQWHDSPTDPTKGVADLTFTLEEGKQFTLRRLEFIGNTYTRDTVIRREVLLNEGDRYNKQLWDLSILRLNQLGYFDHIKDDDVTINTNEREGQVDMTVKLQEKGKQSISLTGGVSGITGSFIGLNYSTNNLFGYGETLSMGVQAGNREKQVSFGFTQPYVAGKPISIGFNVYFQDLEFLGQGFGTAITDPTILSLYNSADLFTQKTLGASVSASAPLSYFAKRFRMGRFVKLGISYSFSTTDILNPVNNQTLTPATQLNNPLAQIPINFTQKGVTQSTVTPSIIYNTLNNGLDPTNGKSISAGVQVSGGVLGGKVNTIEPTFEFKSFRPFFASREGKLTKDPKKTRTLGYRFRFAHIQTLGTPFESNSLSFIDGEPLFSRFYLGGDQDIRGYDIRSISPFVPILTTVNTQDVFATNLISQRLPVRPATNPSRISVAPSVIKSFTQMGETFPLPAGQPQPEVPLGADSEMVFNVEYRIPIVGPVAIVPFLDVGSVFNLNQLHDQFVTSEFVLEPNPLNTVIVNSRGKIASQRSINKARSPETPPGSLPPGFRDIEIFGQEQTVEDIALSRIPSGITSIFNDYRYSTGFEIRVQVPVINVPFRLIFYANPNANTSNPFVIERREGVRFSVGRTF